MPLLVYLDETGDSSLKNIDPGYPVFLVMLFICDVENYKAIITPRMLDIKFKHFGHEGIVLHSRDIRRAQGPFNILTDKAKQEEFVEDLNHLMRSDGYYLKACAVRKDLHLARYGSAAYDPYDLALKFAMERLLFDLEKLGQESVDIVAEARGKQEDDRLRATFDRIATYGTEYISPARFQAIRFRLHFVSKKANNVGTQMADLAAYPTARYILDRSRENLPFDVLRTKFPGGVTNGSSLKIFP